MSFSTLPLSYCTNVHPGRTLHDVLDGLTRWTAPVQSQLGQPIAAGLWLAAPVIRELTADRAAVVRLQTALREAGLVCYTLNAFPYGDFHGERVKEQVYVPDWSTDARRLYTEQCATVLAELLPDGVEGSLSTVPLGFRGFSHPVDFIPRCIEQLLQLADRLDALHDETGRVIRLAIEPEPCCLLETTPETLTFFEQLRERADAAGVGEIVRRHIGVCYDVCHQSVEFEDVQESIARLEAAQVRINKVHITCALRVTNAGSNAAARAALANYIEPRYLHQTIARQQSGGVVRHLDLDAALCSDPPSEFATADEWRVHFHVPVDAESIGPLQTTRGDLRAALAAVRKLPYAPHLEVETYTWSVLPGEAPLPLVEGLARELRATRQLLGELSVRG